MLPHRVRGGALALATPGCDLLVECVLWATSYSPKRLFTFQMLRQLMVGPSPTGSLKFSETRQTWRVRSSLIYRTDVCQLTLRGTEGGGAELNKNKGVSSQKVAYLCSNSLTPSMVQRLGC